MGPASSKSQFDKDGFMVLDAIYSSNEIEELISLINSADDSKATFRKSAGLFAIRQFLKEIPDAKALILNQRLREVINLHFGADYFIIKSIYFDKPQQSNWFVAYHQDLTISVGQKTETKGFGPWTEKQDQYAVQPPLDILNSIYTIRIHLDDTDKENGALKVIPGSHCKNIYRPETIDWTKETEVTCDVKKGGIMIMRPLLLHSSGKTTNNNQRRVIHIEFCKQSLPPGLNWSEYEDLGS
jgi:ectoine hydroxylase-related dioxygenase (phytanoyl-CoA dioxygenase family)